MRVTLLSLVATLAALASCSDEAGKKNTATAVGTDGGADAGDSFTTGQEVRVTVPATGRAYVKLASPAGPVTPADPKADLTWDLAFEGLEVYTNSGSSGPGGASSFGPLDAVAFLDDTAPTVPFQMSDRTGGAFLRWYFYEGAPSHALQSRMHVYGVKDGTKFYKVQVLGYYGDRDGAPVSALYRIRWAEVTPQGIGPVKELVNIDGTAGGPTGAADAPSECVDLGTGTKTMLSPAAARASSAWHLCFRRQDISVNGESGGPRGVGAVDLDADKTAGETLTQVLNRTPESELPRFDAVNAQALNGLDYRGDRVVSGFSGLWITRGSNPPAPAQVAWYVLGGDAKSKYLVGFARFEGATAQSPGTVVMRVKTVK